MGKGISRWLVVVSCAALFAGGCAHKQPTGPSETTTAAPQPAVSEPAEQRTQEPKAHAAETPAPAPAVTETPAPSGTVTTETGATAAPSAQQLQSELQKIYFDFDSSTLSSEARDTLSKNAQYLSKNPDLKVTIEGHCDERGSDEYNMALGERRAKAAREYLVRLGVPADRLSVISYGLEKPAESGHDEAAWAKNRRDEFVVQK